MRLQTLVPPLPQDLVDALENVGIKTDMDLLFSGSALQIFKILPPGSVSPHEFSELVSHVAARISAPAIRGDALLTLEEKRFEAHFHGDGMSSGVLSLDELVGGFGGSRIIEIAGDKAAGKTALALQVVLRHLSNVVPILLEHCAGNAVSTVLDRLQVALTFDIEAAEDVLETLRSSLSDRDASPVMRCVVIDSISSLLSPLLSATSSQGHAIMTTFMRQLRALADAFSLTILVINTSSGSSPWNPDSAFLSTTRKPALGPSFTFLTETTLWLAKCESEGDDPEQECTTHVAEVFRSRTKRSKTWCSFKIRRGVLLSDE
ncbi:P-loop containing nucleoside triphosphate hydrolase protein [Sparassis crispa]|uniref:P-loop containing nucleoside triphosphate hydrolase protein n=1 Tax=Sparassis crispa TaxID=139825 RepID=A0A401H1M9_9APHY|nr:P-loop containing nucleoside triphosphate hydrolase protein [Sparassis crispa]GBE88299.1 P-loop containing nucleoside triphosphate hydrolase protein [Sparassis crispa]